jgi:hypothetical protein
MMSETTKREHPTNRPPSTKIDRVRLAALVGPGRGGSFTLPDLSDMRFAADSGFRGADDGVLIATRGTAGVGGRRLLSRTGGGAFQDSGAGSATGSAEPAAVVLPRAAALDREPAFSSAAGRWEEQPVYPWADAQEAVLATTEVPKRRAARPDRPAAV